MSPRSRGLSHLPVHYSGRIWINAGQGKRSTRQSPGNFQALSFRPSWWTHRQHYWPQRSRGATQSPDSLGSSPESPESLLEPRPHKQDGLPMGLTLEQSGDRVGGKWPKSVLNHIVKLFGVA